MTRMASLAVEGPVVSAYEELGGQWASGKRFVGCFGDGGGVQVFMPSMSMYLPLGE